MLLTTSTAEDRPDGQIDHFVTQMEKTSSSFTPKTQLGTESQAF